MCGIAGFLGDLADPDTLSARAKAMADTLAHRGPDDAGIWIDREAGLALAHRRLSILDLSAEGHQPMASACGRYLMVFNGEVYNHGELRRELEAVGVSGWRGHSDTEVMLAAIVAWGMGGALSRFVGMFAFALWDRDTRTLTLARDRMGEKPLYYGRQGTVLLFGSELKALCAHPACRGEVDRDALALMMRFGYVPAPHSIYRGIHKLPPGCLIRLPADSGPTPYWSPRQAAEAGKADPFTGSPEEATEALSRELSRAVAGQMVADVPLGAFLSGGLDSSTVVALMQAQSSRPVRTFTIGFHEAGYNEAEHAKAVATHLGTDHTELYVTPEEARAVIPRLPALYDEPFADSSQIPTFLVSELARRHVTVSLSGDAGDELFGGYNRYFWAMQLWRRFGRAPLPLRAGLARVLTGVPPGRWDRLFRRIGPLIPPSLRYASPGDKIHKLAGLMGAEHPQAIYRDLVSFWRDPAQLVAGGREPLTVLDSPDEGPSFPEFEQRMMYLDQLTYLPDDILVKVDRAAMGVSLETRVPLLDHRVVEFAWRLPLSLKIRGGQGKWLLRQVLYRHVPRDLVERPKMGFGVPIDQWLRGPLREWAEALIAEERLRREGFLDPGPIQRLWAEHLSGQQNWAYHLWNVLMFQAWLEASHAG